MISLDLAARRVVMAAMAYYGLDESLMSDGEYDDLSNRCADEWKLLTPQRKFALGSAAKIRTSGYHVRVSTMAEEGCASWLIKQGRYDLKTQIILPTVDYKFSKAVGRWRPCSAYQWGTRDDPSRHLQTPD